MEWTTYMGTWWWSKGENGERQAESRGDFLLDRGGPEHRMFSFYCWFLTEAKTPAKGRLKIKGDRSREDRTVCTERQKEEFGKVDCLQLVSVEGWVNYWPGGKTGESSLLMASLIPVKYSTIFKIRETHSAYLPWLKKRWGKERFLFENDSCCLPHTK